jgi:hypothetical protein
MLTTTLRCRKTTPSPTTYTASTQQCAYDNPMNWQKDECPKTELNRRPRHELVGTSDALYQLSYQG